MTLSRRRLCHVFVLPPPGSTVYFDTNSYHVTNSAYTHTRIHGRKRLSVWVEFLKALSAAVINRYETREAARDPECSSAGSHRTALPGLIVCQCVCVCVRDAAHLLLAVKVAARAMPGSLFFRPVGESTLPVLRELECRGNALG